MASRISRSVAYFLFGSLNLGAALGILALHSSLQLTSVFSRFVWWAVAMAVIATAMGWLIQVGEVEGPQAGFAKSAYAGLKVGAVTFAIVSVLSALATHALPRQVTVSFLALSPVISLLSRWPAVVISRTTQPIRVLVVGSYDDVYQLQHEIEGQRVPLCRIVAHINGGDSHPRPSEIGPWVEVTRSKLAEQAVDLNPDVIVVDARYLEDYELLSQVTELHARGVRVRTFSEFYEQMFGKVPVSSINEAWFLFDTGELHRTGYLRLKQAVDLVGALVGSALFLLLFPAIAIAIKIDSRGPVLYFQDRVGKNGKVFRLMKFRTMRVDAETDGPRWSFEGDDRVTRVGKFLRQSRLDELPQFLNVLKGDMSLVGPRAERPEFVEALEEKIPFYSRRHLIKPGLTGWAQIRYRYGSSVEHALEKLQYEFYYMKYQSVFLDLAIILNTLRVMISMKGV